jgi:hypothetical protein
MLHARVRRTRFTYLLKNSSCILFTCGFVPTVGPIFVTFQLEHAHDIGIISSTVSSKKLSEDYVKLMPKTICLVKTDYSAAAGWSKKMIQNEAGVTLTSDYHQSCEHAGTRDPLCICQPLTACSQYNMDVGSHAIHLRSAVRAGMKPPDIWGGGGSFLWL